VALLGPGYTRCKQYRLVCWFRVLHIASYRINSYSYAALEDLESKKRGGRTGAFQRGDALQRLRSRQSRDPRNFSCTFQAAFQYPNVDYRHIYIYIYTYIYTHTYIINSQAQFLQLQATSARSAWPYSRQWCSNPLAIDPRLRKSSPLNHLKKTWQSISTPQFLWLQYLS